MQPGNAHSYAWGTWRQPRTQVRRRTTKANPGGLRATQTSATLPYLQHASSSSSLVTPGSKLPKYVRPPPDIWHVSLGFDLAQSLVCGVLFPVHFYHGARGLQAGGPKIIISFGQHLSRSRYWPPSRKSGYGLLLGCRSELDAGREKNTFFWRCSIE